MILYVVFFFITAVAASPTYIADSPTPQPFSRRQAIGPFKYIRWSTGSSTSNWSGHFNELQLISTSNTNLATSASISIVSGIQEGSTLSNIIDGDINTYIGFQSANKYSIQINFDTVILPSSVSSINFWQYFLDGRSYYDVQLEISLNADNWLTIYGPETTAFTTSGKLISLYPLGIFFLNLIITTLSFFLLYSL